MVILTETARIQRPFSGRVVFDHLPKTAGTSINRWLVEALGEGSVSDILTGLHRSALSRYGGQYCLITGHLDFINAEGLDPRWQYTTVLRDPIDRALSWLYYVINYYSYSSLPEIYSACKNCIESEGNIIAELIYPSISNLYTAHFSRILGLGDEDEVQRLKNSKAVLDQYDLVGTTDDYDHFVGEFAKLLQITHIPPTRIFNKTEGRPDVKGVSTALRDRLTELNQLDIDLYEHARTQIEQGRWAQKAGGPGRVEIIAYPKRAKECRESKGVSVHNFNIIGQDFIKNKNVIMVESTIDIEIPISIMQCGLHIIDDREEIAFGINTTLLGQDIRDVSPGRYTITYQVMADLPTGRYSIGISFYDKSYDIPKELYWHDGLHDFSVLSPKGISGIGYALCRTQISVNPFATIEAATP